MRVNIDPYIFNPIYWHIKDALKNESIRYILIYGGSSAAKTYSISQALMLDTVENKYDSIAFRKIQNNISDTIKRDFDGINNAMFTKKLPLCRPAINGISIGDNFIKYRGIDSSGKIQGLSNYKKLYANELRHFDYEDWKEFKRRLRGQKGQQIIGDWNPVDKNHWIKREIINKETWTDLPLCIPGNKYSQLNELSEKKINKSGDMLLIKTTYRDNYWVVGHPDKVHGFRDEHALNEFERMRLNDPDDYEIYGNGNWGVITSRLIFTRWERKGAVEVVDTDGLREYYFNTDLEKLKLKRIPSGMDFGFSPDPSVLVDLYTTTYKGQPTIIVDERLYDRGLTHISTDNILEETIQGRLLEMDFDKNWTIIADSANPTGIRELRNVGFDMYGVKKQPILDGIRAMKGFYFLLTERSVNVENEFENYKKKIDKNGVILPEPIDEFNHSIDPIRYVLTEKDKLW